MSSSNIDRYRPTREGFPPPSLPPKPPVPISERASKSPVRRRDVPPAVPSPPTHTSRTSPPRPHSRRTASPAQSSPRRSSQQPRLEQWLFTPDEVASSPSIIDGLSPAEVRLRRAKGIGFISSAGVLLGFSTITLWVAGVFFHRFFMRYSMVEEKGGIHHYNIAATALFLANKTEENCRKTKEIIIAVARVAQKNTKLEIDEQSKEYWRWRDSILTYEELMLETLTFDLMVDNPYHRLYEVLEELKLLDQRKLRDACWAFCNDSCLTALPLLATAREIAIGAIFFGAITSKFQIDDINGTPWWVAVHGDESRLALVVNTLADFYRENPLKKQENRYALSPEFKLESTRRRGELNLSLMDVDTASQVGTPTPTGHGMDRGSTQSPNRERTNGNDNVYAKQANTVVAIKKELSSEEAKKSIEVDNENRGDSDAALKAAANNLSAHVDKQNVRDRHEDDGLISPRPFKRKSAELEDDLAREAKKVKLENDDDEDEGEIKVS
ncbi:cyclin-like protein [Podospora australis]|uniref:RNA polymerase II holoenzyme cyclin-like subunit n=1 Tax=Podospora australis TaxID=1536484 RepID=A0AAN6X8L6_9PEZI|nr:cyclin-like protein [Podospora australis]